jgi:hypothetical protein
VRRLTALLVFGLLAPACAAPARPSSPVRVAAPVVTVPRSAPALRIERCFAQPSTLYGDEEVVFEIEAEAPAGSLVQVELLDQAQRSVLRRATPVPGRMRISDLSSGDFSLRIADSAVSCAVTVNRELSRGSSSAR